MSTFVLFAKEKEKDIYRECARGCVRHYWDDKSLKSTFSVDLIEFYTMK